MVIFTPGMKAAASPAEAVREYIAEIQDNLKSGIAREPTHRPALERLLESLDPAASAFNDPAHISVGAPDFTIRRKGHATDFPIGWAETKDVGDDLDKVEKSEQLQRYVGSLQNLVLTDYLEFRWYTDGKKRLTARLASLGPKHALKRSAEGEKAVVALLSEFLRQSIASVSTPKELAEQMARLTHMVRDLLLRAYETEDEKGRLHGQFQAFRETLIPDLDAAQFADMYAQTIAYGLFAARCQPGVTSRGFDRARAADLIPRTNPFLRKLFQSIAFDLDERVVPFVDDLVALLRDADIGAIMADFGRRTAREDPVVHFYEDFLKEYDPKVRELRGVYYTPEPVVSYIVRSVDEILKTQFKKPMGLADKDVLILDPACGTGTFLYYVIRHIYEAVARAGQKGQWNSYVSENLLKRIFGFELLMAPYAVAHLKLGLLLQELGYKFESEERLGIYLTNTLEEAIRRAQRVFAFADAITNEAVAAQQIKRDDKIMVVLGNPPYSGHSANRSWEVRIDGKTKKPKKVPTFIGNLLQDYYKVDGKPLGEKNPKWLQDDYVKFIRFGQWRIQRTGYGILAFITNNGYLDNPTFRGMRQNLMDAFTDISLLDLHGNSKKKEAAPDGSKDENVFDIQQGVGIGLFVKKHGVPDRALVRHAELWGLREAKYKNLFKADVDSTKWKKLRPSSPNHLFIPRSENLATEYQNGWNMLEAMPLNVLGFQTHRDHFAIDFEMPKLRARIGEMRATGTSDEAFRLKYNVPDNGGWQLSPARSRLREDKQWQAHFVTCLYRPFDWRACYFNEAAMDRPRSELVRNLLRPNIALNLVRQTKAREWKHAMVSNAPTPAVFVEIKDGSTVFPLWLYGAKGRQGLFESGDEAPTANFSPQFTNALKKFGNLTEPRAVLNYVYSILHSPAYRLRYNEFLRADFPRIPLTSDKRLFAALAAKGAELISLHLMESPRLSKFITRYEQPGDHGVEKVRYAEANAKAGIKSGRVYINGAQYFEGVPRDVWEFQIGGYQVCEKWLKDRKGRRLSSDEIDHYQKIVVALSETIRIMGEIDEIIPGWPLP